MNDNIPKEKPIDEEITLTFKVGKQLWQNYFIKVREEHPGVNVSTYTNEMVIKLLRDTILPPKQ